MKTLTVGQLLEDLFALARHLTPAHFTNVVDVRLTTRGLEVETTSDEDLADEIEELRRELGDAGDENNSLEARNEELSDKIEELEERVKELEKQLEQQLKDQTK